MGRLARVERAIGEAAKDACATRALTSARRARGGGAARRCAACAALQQRSSNHAHPDSSPRAFALKASLLRPLRPAWGATGTAARQHLSRSVGAHSTVVCAAPLFLLRPLQLAPACALAGLGTRPKGPAIVSCYAACSGGLVLGGQERRESSKMVDSRPRGLSERLYALAPLSGFVATDAVHYSCNPTYEQWQLCAVCARSGQAVRRVCAARRTASATAKPRGSRKPAETERTPPPILQI